MRSAIDWLTRAVPIASNGFIAATSTKPSAAAIRPSRGTTISRSAIAVISTLRVSSGIRLSSSRYSSSPDRIAVTSGPSVHASGV